MPDEADAKISDLIALPLEAAFNRWEVPPEARHEVPKRQVTTSPQDGG